MSAAADGKIISFVFVFSLLMFVVYFNFSPLVFGQRGILFNPKILFRFVCQMNVRGLLNLHYKCR